jgi:hypothetical protein
MHKSLVADGLLIFYYTQLFALVAALAQHQQQNLVFLQFFAYLGLSLAFKPAPEWKDFSTGL